MKSNFYEALCRECIYIYINEFDKKLDRVLE